MGVKIDTTTSGLLSLLTNRQNRHPINRNKAFGSGTKDSEEVPGRVPVPKPKFVIIGAKTLQNVKAVLFIYDYDTNTRGPDSKAMKISIL
jgi:hypothetical protein